MAQDKFWTIRFIVSLSCLILSLPLLVSIMRSIDRTSMQSMSAKSMEPLLPFTKISARLSALLNVLCIAFYFATFPICIKHKCTDNAYGLFTYLSTANTYILSNQFFKKIYSYSTSILYGLCTMMVLSFLVLILVNIWISTNSNAFLVKEADTAGIVLFVCLDFSLSVFTLIAFIVPLCTQYGSKMKLHIIKYIVLSTVAIISSTFCGILMIFRYNNNWIHPFGQTHVNFIDILNSCKCIDCLISLIVIYFGFVSKTKYAKYCGQCNRICLKLAMLKNASNKSSNINMYGPLINSANAESDDMDKTFCFEQTTTITTTASSTT